MVFKKLSMEYAKFDEDTLDELKQFLEDSCQANPTGPIP